MGGINQLVTGISTALKTQTTTLQQMYLQDKNKKAGEELLVPYNALTGKGVPQECINRYHQFYKLYSYVGKSAVQYYNNELTKGKDANGLDIQVDYRVIAQPLTGKGIIIDCSGM